MKQTQVEIDKKALDVYKKINTLNSFETDVLNTNVTFSDDVKDALCWACDEVRSLWDMMYRRGEEIANPPAPQWKDDEAQIFIYKRHELANYEHIVVLNGYDVGVFGDATSALDYANKLKVALNTSDYEIVFMDTRLIK